MQALRLGEDGDLADRLSKHAVALTREFQGSSDSYGYRVADPLPRPVAADRKPADPTARQSRAPKRKKAPAIPRALSTCCFLTAIEPAGAGSCLSSNRRPGPNQNRAGSSKGSTA